MNKTAKGALGASAAAVLLMGGAGSLAFWTSSDTVDGGSVTAGTLGIKAKNIAGTSSPCDASWVYAAGNAKAGQVVNLVVPGDKVTKKCTFSIEATGDNLKAKVTAPASLNVSGTPAGTSFVATSTATYALSGATNGPIADGGVITSADNGDTLTATFVVTIPFGTGETGSKVNANDTKGILAKLDTLTVSVQQLDPNA